MALDPYFDKTVLLLHGETVDPYGAYLVAGYSGKSLTPELGTGYAQNAPVAGTFDGYPAVKLASTSGLWAYGASTGVFDGDFTIEGWTYQTAYSAYDVFFASCAGTTNTYHGCYLYYAGAGGYFYVGVRGSSRSFTVARPSLNAWHHFAIVSASGVVSLYVDGVRVGMASFANSTAYTACNGARFGYASGLGDGLVGYGSDLRVYKGVAKYAGATYALPARPGLPYGAQLDSSPKERNVGGVGSPTSLYTGMSRFGGGCMRFDGAGYLECAASADWQFGTVDFTIEAWVNRDANDSWKAVVSQWRNTNDAGWSLDIDSGSNRLCFLMISGGFDYSLYAGSGPPVGEWAHIAVTRRGDSLRLFLNGAKVAERTGVSAVSFGAPGSVVRIGRAVAFTNWFIGYIDELRITKGVARYFESFTPPTEAFPNTQAVVSGVVRDASGAPCARKVFAHSRGNGRLLGTAVSDPVTGVYEIAADETCYVVCLDADASYNAKIVDGVDPTA